MRLKIGNFRTYVQKHTCKVMAFRRYGTGNIVNSIQNTRNEDLRAVYRDGQNIVVQNPPPNNDDLADIRHQARNVWLEKSKSCTSYRDDYNDKHSQIDGYQTTRPSSAHRKHKPHPKKYTTLTMQHYDHIFINFRNDLCSFQRIFDDAASSRPRLS